MKLIKLQINNMEKLERQNESDPIKASAWQEKYKEILDDFFQKENVSRKELIDIIWEYGILERISPKNENEKQARKSLKKTVWEGDRENPELYWRLLYSTAASLEAIKNKYSIVAPSYGYITGAFEGLNRALLPQHCQAIFPESEKNPNTNFHEIILNDIIEKAKSEIENKGKKPPKNLIPYGTEINWQGQKFNVERYTFDGKILLEADTPEKHNFLFDTGVADGIPPEKINHDQYI